MPAAPRSKRTRDKVKAHRERLRRQGLRPIQVWVPDVRSPAFQAEAHRQSLAVARSAQEREDQDFIDSVSGWAPNETRRDLDPRRRPRITRASRLRR